MKSSQMIRHTDMEYNSDVSDTVSVSFIRQWGDDWHKLANMLVN